MLLGIVLHAGIPYSTRQLAWWPVADGSTSRAVDAFLLVTHSFRMHLFFFIAGLFSAIMLRRRGLRGFLRSRIQRILLPWVVGVVTFAPLTVAAGNYARWLALPADARPALSAALVGGASASGGPFISLFGWGDAHLWFLRFLIAYTALGAACAAIALRWPPLDLTRPARPMISWWLGSRWRVLAAAAVTVPAALLTAGGRAFAGPPDAMWLVYLVFFAAGWLAGGRAESVQALARGGRTALLTAGLAVLLAGPAQASPPLLVAVHTLFGWGLVLGLVGVFLRYLDRPSPFARSLAEASFWMYLAHLPVVIVLGAWAAEVKGPVIIELACVCGIACFGLFACHRWVIRPAAAWVRGPDRPPPVPERSQTAA